MLENTGISLADSACARRSIATSDNPQAPLQEILTELESLKTPLSQTSATNDQTLSSVKEDSQPEPIQDQMFEDSDDVNLEKDLQTILVEYDQTVIRQQLPDTDKQRRLLRPAMLEALMHELPSSLAEFQERIPAFLRNGTEPAEGRYLEKILHLISVHGDG